MRAYADMDILANMLGQLFEEAVDPDEVPDRLAGLALAAESLRTRRLLEEKHTPQQIEFERDYWQRKVGALLSLIERDAPDLHERACLLVNTDRSGYLNAADAQAAFAGIFADRGEDPDEQVP